MIETITVNDERAGRLSAGLDNATHEHAFAFVTQRCWCGMTMREWHRIEARLEKLALGRL